MGSGCIQSPHRGAPRMGGLEGTLAGRFGAGGMGRGQQGEERDIQRDRRGEESGVRSRLPAEAVMCGREKETSALLP